MTNIFDNNALSTSFDPATYRVARAEWKTAYKALSAQIRALKIEIKNDMRAGIYTGSEQNKLASLQYTATSMLEELAEAKGYAREAWKVREAA